MAIFPSLSKKSPFQKASKTLHPFSHLKISHVFPSHPIFPIVPIIGPGRAAGFHPTDGLLGDQQRRWTARDGRGADGNIHLGQDLPAPQKNRGVLRWKMSEKNGKKSGKMGEEHGKGWILEKKTDLLADFLGETTEKLWCLSIESVDLKILNQEKDGFKQRKGNSKNMQKRWKQLTKQI
jgi:hypothetical protein